MTTEENRRILALACIVADLKADNMYLTQRARELKDEYNNVALKLTGNDKRKDKDQLKQTIVEMREQCYKLERENRELKFFAKGVYSFVKEKNLYIKKGDECPYRHKGIAACSTYCMSCGSRLGDIYGYGVICDKRLEEANVSLPADE